MKLIHLISAAISLAFVMHSASAQAGASPDTKQKARSERLFNRFDKNKDGQLDPEELRLSRESAFKKRDSNGDGVIDQNEIRALADKRSKGDAKISARIENQMKRLDSDGDGSVTKVEATSEPSWLAKADSNKDRKVSREEYEAWSVKLRERAEAREQKKKNDRADDDAADADDED